MSDPKNPGEAAIDSVVGAVGLIWRWLSAPEEQGVIALLGGDESPPDTERDVVQTEGEEVWRDE